MAMPFVSALPLRLPVPQNDMVGMMASWMDNSPGLGLSGSECRRDLETIDRLRRDIAQSLGERGQQPLSGSDAIAGTELSVSGIIEKLHEYYHFLLECEEHGMVMVRTAAAAASGSGSASGGSSEQLESSSHQSPPSGFVFLEWHSATPTTGPFQIETAHGLESERANVMWNLAALEAHQASKENLATKLGWNKASKRLQNAASWLGHLVVLLQDLEQQQQQQPHQSTQQKQCSELSATFVVLWQALLLAQAQHCIYESLTCVKRPMQLLAAKLAAAAVPLYGEVERIATETTPSQCSSDRGDLVPKWAQFARAWGAYMSCMAEYHQSHIHRQKKAWGQELARLDVAYQHAAICKSLCDCAEESSTILPPQTQTQTQPPQIQTILDELRTAVDETLKLLRSRMDTAERENDEKHKHKIPTQHELTEIRGENLVKSDAPLSKLLRTKTTEPIFQTNTQTTNTTTTSSTTTPPISEAGVAITGNNNYNHVVKSKLLPLPPTGTTPPLSSTTSSFLDQKKKASPIGTIPTPNLTTYAEVFRVEMNEIIDELAHATEDQTESARLAIAEVHLPHSLTAYKQEQSGGGLPEDLWQRVHVIQQDHKIIRLKQDLWEVKDAADLARATHQKITSQLDFDINSDRKFREANSEFEGHDAWEVQRSFRKHLTNYDKLLFSAQEGDSVLFRRLEQLDIEPKYNLLQFSKSQLDRLLPGARGGNTTHPGDDTDDSSSIAVDTQHLSYLLGELSALFQERANLMDRIRNDFQGFDILEALTARVDPARGTDRDYVEATKHAQKSFDTTRQTLETNMTRQNELLGTILLENERFMNARERTTNSQSADSCIVMIEDAIEEIDQLSKHLKEGKDFYNVVIPKLDELRQRVDDVSARLTVERLEYGEKERRASQERKDAVMAKNLFSNESLLSSSSSAAQTTTNMTSVDAAAIASTPDAAAGDGAVAARLSPSRSSTNESSSQPPPPNHQHSRDFASFQARTVGTVDDGKVATLVAMEFDADKVVAALEKHDNNMDRALNELLSC